MVNIPMSRISGCVPGVLDPTQTQRLCLHPGSRLSFASFDPHIASVQGNLCRLTLNQEFCHSKRIVIETTVEGKSFWRFVPNARKDKGLIDEAMWPRVIDICGFVSFRLFNVFWF